MSPAILTEDILFHVVSHLSATHSRSARRTLVRLARVHSTFKKPALAVLWRSLPSAEALEHLLCAIGIAQEDPQNDHHGLTHLSLNGTLETHRSGWERFQEYSVLVREITLDPFFVPAQHPLGFGFSSFDPEDTFWGHLTSTFGITSILPCLKVVTLRSSDSVRFSTFNPDTLRFLNPSIRGFNVDVASVSPEGRWKFAQFFATCFSSVEDLDVIALNTLVPVLDFESLPQLHSRLRRLTVLSIQSDELSHLASLQNLEYLSIGMARRDERPPDLPIKLLQLRNLTLSSYQSSGLSAFLANVDVPQLQSFSGSMSQSRQNPKEVYEELSNVLRLLVAKCPALISFSWATDRWVRNDDRSGAGALQLAELVAPLLSVRTIRNFSASFRPYMISYTPSDFRAFAQAWPELETLELRIVTDENEADENEADENEADGNEADENAYADFESLVSFAHHCPRLRRLHIPTFKFDHAADTTATVRPPVSHWLQSLYVETVVLSAKQPEDEASESFLRLMQEVFPEADIDFGF
ncbi:hypothetical protein GSI_01107 [Ganoderma sinense ZZ0214-1]|uniref:F-box domain-containing protein n=1 Tax=Ganoderma sinense ZZ0214-1 TaxID=1077348 RepID=A0A2G8SUL7_9APHY|nr:hypothetical protein GSI_01107 [Ganoderma sinense ZZ0214-1]